MPSYAPRLPAVVIGPLALAGCFGSHADAVDAGATDAAVAADSGADGAVDDWYEDTLGWRVQFRCEGGRRCSPPVAAPSDHPVECPEGMTRRVARTIDGRVPTLLATCADERGWFAWTEVARPFRCTEDATCARLQHLDATPQCVDGICQVPAEPLDVTDVLAYCMAFAPRPARALTYPLAPELSRAWELTETTCPEGGDTCTVPAECAWPRSGTSSER